MVFVFIVAMCAAIWVYADYREKQKKTKAVRITLTLIRPTS
jgi:hypothetical protein